ncbi:MAG: hypothetical protein AAFX44_00875 [Pseudomonadota bacterium]
MIKPVTDDSITDPSTHTVWQTANRLLPTWRRAATLSLLLFGAAPWLRRDRLERMEASSCARYLRTALPSLARASLADLAIRARINREMASSAFRQMVVVNITIPVAVVALVNELSDGALLRLGLDLFGGQTRLAIAIMMVIVMMASFVFYAYTLASNARELHMLIQLYGGRDADSTDDDDAIESI